MTNLVSMEKNIFGNFEQWATQMLAYQRQELDEMKKQTKIMQESAKTFRLTQWIVTIIITFSLLWTMAQI